MLGPRKTSGFTLSEVMVVMVVLGIFLAIGIPSFRQMILNFQIRALSESILNGVQLARSTAVQRNENVNFQLSTSGSVYTLGWSVQTDSGTAIQSRASGESSSNLQLGVSPATAKIVTFNGMGRVVSNLDGSASLTTIDVDVPTTVMPAADSRDLRIRILSGGMIKMCNHNITDTTDVTFCP